MSTDQSANRTSGETQGVEQKPTESGEHDATQREQEQREGQQPTADPRAHDADREDSLASGQAGTSSAGMPDTNTHDEGRT